MFDGLKKLFDDIFCITLGAGFSISKSVESGFLNVGQDYFILNSEVFKVFLFGLIGGGAGWLAKELLSHIMYQYKRLRGKIK